MSFHFHWDILVNFKKTHSWNVNSKNLYSLSGYFTSNIILFIIFTQFESPVSKLICSILCKKKRSNIKLIIHKFLLNCRFENYIGDQVIFYNWYVFYSTSRRTSRVAAAKTSTTEVNPTMPNYCLLLCFYVTFYSKCWKMWKEFVKIAKVPIFYPKIGLMYKYYYPPPLIFCWIYIPGRHKKSI